MTKTPATIDLDALASAPASAVDTLVDALDATPDTDETRATLWTEQFAASGKQGKSAD